MSTGAQVVFLLVIGARFLVPLLILRYPLPAIVASLLLDGVDQTIFQTLGYDPPGYQSYDKAMDVFYLAVAYLATLRNWQSLPAFRVGRFLYFYRLVGVVAFEFTQVRALLLVFANTFEYFFIFYEAVRVRWSPRRFGLRWWVVAAALIWVVVKLPQEYWIHVAQLDLTDTLRDYWWAWPVLICVVLAAVAVVWFAVIPRLGPVDWPWRLVADPLPAGIGTAEEQYAWQAHSGRVASWATVEKIVLVGLISVVYGEILPGVRSTALQLFVGIAVLVVANAALTVALARSSRTVASSGIVFAERVLVNLVLVYVADYLLDREGGNLAFGPALFFMCLISLITTLHDRYRPVLAVRTDRERTAAAG